MEAQQNNLDSIEFNDKGTNIKVKIKKVYIEGVMRGNRGYYSE